MPNFHYKLFVCLIVFCVMFVNCFSVLAKDKRGKIVEERGGEVKVVKYKNGTWELLVEGKPYFIKGVVFNPNKIGEDPNVGTLRDWMEYDDNANGKNDIEYDTYIDKNNNNKQDADEPSIGDFQMLKDMGCNTIRLYHVASNNPILGEIYRTSPGMKLQFDHALNKNLLRDLYLKYGIRAIIGHYIGAWTIGTGTSWKEGTDYTNPKHTDAIKKSVRAMVEDSKDEPYVLFWLLGNENNVAPLSDCNARQQPQAYAKFIGELVDMIHQIDPNHPVAICDGEDGFKSLRLYAKYAKNLDILGFNSYRGPFGFGTMWNMCKYLFDRPVFMAEYGIGAYTMKTGENQDFQMKYVKGCWEDIVKNSSFYYQKKGNYAGNSIGGTVFEWTDIWWQNGKASVHNAGRPIWPGGYSVDGFMHEEWCGIVALGDGSDYLVRQLRKSYYYLQNVWKKEGMI